MKSWSTRDDVKPQSNLWQVYGKVRGGYWVSFGQPMTRADAESEVEVLRHRPNVGEPHCVPL